jgi:hypothetical protein
MCRREAGGPISSERTEGIVDLGGVEKPVVRRLFMVLSPRSLPYARLAIESLFKNCDEAISLCLITDSPLDTTRLRAELSGLACSSNQTLSVYGQLELEAIAEEKFEKFEHIQNFRKGHPCWRKITDPILLSRDNQEMVVLDPDLYFPNRFRFELTPARGILLMWQRPSCLLPPEVVETAMAAHVALAHHTDIGVAQWRLPVDLEWLNWLIGRIGSHRLPLNMHVESIVWAALAMRMGGGYLDPSTWHCWHRTQFKRLLRRLGIPGPRLLRLEPFASAKCFHAGGEAKWWLAGAKELGILDKAADHFKPSAIRPYVKLSRSKYKWLQYRRAALHKLGYYKLLGSNPAR